MGKKKNVKNVTKNEENNVIIETVTVNETSDNTVDNNNVIPSQNIIEPVVNNTMGFDDLYYAKKCNEMLLSHYDNLVRIIPSHDTDYESVSQKLNQLKTIDIQLMNKMSEKMMDLDLC